MDQQSIRKELNEAWDQEEKWEGDFVRPSKEAEDQMVIDTLEKELKHQRRRLTDQQYMLEAYLLMLGPKALEVAKMWATKGVVRVHHSWGPGSSELSGEERAQVLLDLEEAIKDAVPLDLDENIEQIDIKDFVRGLSNSSPE